ncbi:hypothetical protein GCM10010465_11860 [Actinomadura fibrosa]
MGCEKEEVETTGLDVANASVKALNTVKITSTGMNFIAPEEIPSGWNTFSYLNKTGEPHFFILVKIPEDKTLEEYHEEVTVPFNNWLKTWREGAPVQDPGIALWFFTDAVNTGGSGLIDAGETAVTSINLQPGNYIIECYVKLPNGDFHSVVGMLDQIRVTEEGSKVKEPKSDVSLIIDGNGMTMEGEVKRPGLHTFSVDFIPGSAADVHLVRIEDPEGADRNQLNDWMYWANIIGYEKEGLMTPAPAGFSFLGGSQELAQGGRTYFQAVLKPGTYALISEVADPMSSGHYVEFEVE